MTDTGYVLKTESGEYFCGLNVWDSQLRKAKIYHSENYARKIIDRFHRKYGDIALIKVKIEEVEE